MVAWNISAFCPIKDNCIGYYVSNDKLDEDIFLNYIQSNIAFILIIFL